MPIYEGFGMSECAGTYSLATNKTWKMGYCGRPLKGYYEFHYSINLINL